MTDIKLEQDAKTTTTLVYALQAASFVVGITFIAAVIINYVKRDEVRGTIAESHFEWQIRTFWIGVILSVLGVITMPVLIGFVILFANAVWVIYRIVKGWLNLNENKPMPIK